MRKRATSQPIVRQMKLLDFTGTVDLRVQIDPGLAPRQEGRIPESRRFFNGVAGTASFPIASAAVPATEANANQSVSSVAFAASSAASHPLA